MNTRQIDQLAKRSGAVATLAAAILLFQTPVVGLSGLCAETAAPGPKPAREAFEQFKKLAGNWQGRSTKGWDEKVSFKSIAAGSIVVEDSFDAHPDETMMTMYYLDGDRLILTHYCVAKNQPRLVATSFADGGKAITFTFLDGANIPTRDRGHMDKVIVRFLDDNHVTKQWTWYENGKEKWMEEIRLDRLPAKAEMEKDPISKLKTKEANK